MWLSLQFGRVLEHRQRDAGKAWLASYVQEWTIWVQTEHSLPLPSSPRVGCGLILRTYRGADVAMQLQLLQCDSVDCPEATVRNLIQDLRLAIRQMRRSPGFAVTAV